MKWTEKQLYNECTADYIDMMVKALNMRALRQKRK